MKITFAREENNIYKTFFPSFHRKAVLPSDFPRRGRAYDQASYKCHEWRNLSLYAFPVIAKCLEPAKLREKKIFTAFGFLSRAYRLPEDEYEYVPREMLNIATNYINDNYTQAFGETAGSYNYHMVSAHLPEIRERQGPFTMHNAYPFEGSYAEMRKSFIPGTRKFFYCISFIKKHQINKTYFYLSKHPKANHAKDHGAQVQKRTYLRSETNSDKGRENTEMPRRPDLHQDERLLQSLPRSRN